MRPLSVLIPLILSAATQAQLPILTYFAVPPDNGCDGIWAVQASTMNCGAAPYTYATTPTGCVQLTGWTTDQDTLFMPLCAYPCTLVVASMDATICDGSTGTTAGIQEAPSPSLRITTTAAGIEVSSDTPLPAGTWQVIGPAGHLEREQRTPPGLRWHLPPPASEGSYLLLFSGEEARYRQRFVYTR